MPTTVTDLNKTNAEDQKLFLVTKNETRQLGSQEVASSSENLITKEKLESQKAELQDRITEVDALLSKIEGL